MRQKPVYAIDSLSGAGNFPEECPAFMLLDAWGFAFDASAKAGEIVEGTFNDQGTSLMLGFARPEGPRLYFGQVDPAMDQFRCAWHYTGRLLPLTKAAREMLAVVTANG